MMVGAPQRCRDGASNQRTHSSAGRHGEKGRSSGRKKAQAPRHPEFDRLLAGSGTRKKL